MLSSTCMSFLYWITSSSIKIWCVIVYSRKNSECAFSKHSHLELPCPTLGEFLTEKTTWPHEMLKRTTHRKVCQKGPLDGGSTSRQVTRGHAATGRGGMSPAAWSCGGISPSVTYMPPWPVATCPRVTWQDVPPTTTGLFWPFFYRWSFLAFQWATMKGS
jgi:hypothetical protein